MVAAVRLGPAYARSLRPRSDVCGARFSVQAYAPQSPFLLGVKCSIVESGRDNATASLLHTADNCLIRPALLQWRRHYDAALRRCASLHSIATTSGRGCLRRAERAALHCRRAAGGRRAGDAIPGLAKQGLQSWRAKRARRGGAQLERGRAGRGVRVGTAATRGCSRLDWRSFGMARVPVAGPQAASLAARRGEAAALRAMRARRAWW